MRITFEVEYELTKEVNYNMDTIEPIEEYVFVVPGEWLHDVYNNYVVEPNDLKCTSQLTNGATDVTLITCTMTGKQRTIIKARAVNVD